MDMCERLKYELQMELALTGQSENSFCLKVYKTDGTVKWRVLAVEVYLPTSGVFFQLKWKFKLFSSFINYFAGKIYMWQLFEKS